MKYCDIILQNGLDGAIGMELLGRKAVLIADGGVWFRQDS